ncbi:hypothetical protein DASC09_008330 [Saccharomycopsis crataegensis]|uniref:Uncharacterized protein n=1 Tax=Saccharomycopsis crataegensis TaxID=43959 RepID=A0AAV5QH62_9ASCO|nr:hypothetical protein DASC09_008330 [Saccharomycopsis crataegensis]
MSKDRDLKSLHKKIELQPRAKTIRNEHRTMSPTECTEYSNRMLSSHTSVFQTLENSELNNIALSSIAESGRKIIDNESHEGKQYTTPASESGEDPAPFSITSWQSISGSVQMSPNRQYSNDTNSHINSILSLSSDGEDGVTDIENKKSERFLDTESKQVNGKLSALLNHTTNIADTLSADQLIDKDYDSDESGTFEIDVNALIKNNDNPLLTRNNGSTTSGVLSPSLIMPKMMVASKVSSANNLRLCVIGSGLSTLKKELNICNGKQLLESGFNETTFSFQYLFTNLNSKVNVVVLVFDSANGLYSKDLFNILARYRKPVLPLIYETPVKKKNKKKTKGRSRIVAGGISDGESDYDENMYVVNEKFDVSESALTTLLLNNGIRLFNSPIRVDESEPLTFQNLHQIISSYFVDKRGNQLEEDDDQEENEEMIQSNASIWTTTIIQNTISSESEHNKKAGTRHHNRASVIDNATPGVDKKRRMSNSNSFSFSKSRKKRLDRKRLSYSKINNSDPLKLNEKKSYIFNSFTIGVGLGIVSLATVIVYYNKLRADNDKNLLPSVVTSEEVIEKSAWRRFLKHTNFQRLVYNESSSYSDRSLIVSGEESFGQSYSLSTSMVVDALIDSTKRMIYDTKIVIFNSVYFFKGLFGCGFLFVS